MKLYEVTNGYTGESYVRVYVWTYDAERAVELARNRFGHKSRLRLQCELLLSDSDEEFATAESDSGWERVP